MRNFFIIVAALFLLLPISCISFAMPQYPQEKVFMENSSEKEVIKILIRNDKKSEIFYYVFADEKDNICMDGSVVITKNRSINYKMCVSNKGEIASEHVYLDDKFRKARKTKKEVFCLNEFVRGIFKEEYVDSYYSLPPDVIEKFNKVFNIEKKHVFNQ